MTKHSSKTQRSGKKQKVEKLEFVQDFLPIKSAKHSNCRARFDLGNRANQLFASL